MKTKIPWEDSSQDQEECRLPQSTNIRCLPCGIIACAPKIPPVRVFVFSVLQFSLLAICWHFLKFDLFARWWLRLGFEVWESKNEVFLKVKEIVLILFPSSATILWELPSGPQSHTKRMAKSPTPWLDIPFMSLQIRKDVSPNLFSDNPLNRDRALYFLLQAKRGEITWWEPCLLSNKKGNKTRSGTGIADCWLSIRTLSTSSLCPGNLFLRPL